MINENISLLDLLQFRAMRQLNGDELMALSRYGYALTYEEDDRLKEHLLNNRDILEEYETDLRPYEVNLLSQEIDDERIKYLSVGDIVLNNSFDWKEQELHDFDSDSIMTALTCMVESQLQVDNSIGFSEVTDKYGRMVLVENSASGFLDIANFIIELCKVNPEAMEEVWETATVIENRTGDREIDIIRTYLSYVEEWTGVEINRNVYRINENDIFVYGLEL